MSVEALLTTGAQERSLIIDTIGNAVDLQIDAINSLRRALSGTLMDSVVDSVELIMAAQGRVIVTGIGKSGIIGRKIAATLASTGTPAYFMHATEGSHGDLGMVTDADVIVALSWSGETAELFDVIFYSRAHNVPLIAITSGAKSTLARRSDVLILLPKVREVCQHGLAPSSSTLLQAAIGDAMAIAVSERRDFHLRDFQERHPGGKLGAMLQLVSDIMTTTVPLVDATTRMDEALIVMSGSRWGALGVVDQEGRLVGEITDGEIRRHMGSKLLDLAAHDIMVSPIAALAPDTRMTEAAAFMTSVNRSVAFVLDPESRPIGILHVQDAVKQLG